MTEPTRIEDLLQLAQGDLQAGWTAQAASHLRRAAAIAPEDARVDVLQAGVAGRRDDHAGVLAAIDRAIEKGIEPPPQIRFARIHALYTLGRVTDALAAIEAIDAPAGSPLAHNLLGLKAKCLERDGDLDELAAVLDDLGRAEDGSPRLERLRAGLDRRRQDPEASIARLERLLERTDLPLGDRVSAGFDLARLLDRASRWTEAFDAARSANELVSPGFDGPADARDVEAMIEQTGRDWATGPTCSTETSGRPVFIVGMPRTGTSLLEQIIASHPDACGIGERQDPFILREDLGLELGGSTTAGLETASAADLDRAAASYLKMLDLVGATGRRVTNKALGLDRVVDFLARVFPESRFLWIHRDPRDAVLSAYLHQIHKPWAWRIPDLLTAHEHHRRLREHWLELLPDRCLEVRYETLVEHPESEIDRVVTALDLVPAEACRRFHESSRVVLTPSHDQVRRPMNRMGIGRWERYRNQLGPEFGILGPHSTD